MDRTTLTISMTPRQPILDSTYPTRVEHQVLRLLVFLNGLGRRASRDGVYVLIRDSGHVGRRRRGLGETVRARVGQRPPWLLWRIYSGPGCESQLNQLRSLQDCAMVVGIK